MKFALVKDGVVKGVIGADDGCQLVEVTGGVEVRSGYLYDGETFTPSAELAAKMQFEREKRELLLKLSKAASDTEVEQVLSDYK